MTMPSLPIDYVGLSLFTISWTLGMVAMMFPTAMPMMLMIIHVGRTSSEDIRAGGGPTAAKAVIFILSYISFWAGLGVVMYIGLAFGLSVLTPQAPGVIGSTLGLGIALLIVGIYQLSPLKVECLNRCHPTSFLFKYYRGGTAGAARMGAIYAKYCIGCCWVMMVFLLLIGSMGILWMGAFAGIIFVERVLVSSRWTPRILGVGFLASGIAFAVSSLL
jgi:predicted metal-binding membrane protein